MTSDGEFSLQFTKPDLESALSELTEKETGDASPDPQISG